MRKRDYRHIIKKILGSFFVCFLVSGIVCMIWIVQRKNMLKNHTLLMQYEETEPHMIHSENDAILYYEYILEDGTVTLQVSKEDGAITHIIVFDEKRGFLKQYDGKVLRFVWDFEMESVCKFFSIPYTTQKEVHTAQECEQLNILLQEEKYEEISAAWRVDMITTSGNTLFIE